MEEKKGEDDRRQLASVFPEAGSPMPTELRSYCTIPHFCFLGARVSRLLASRRTIKGTTTWGGDVCLIMYHRLHRTQNIPNVVLFEQGIESSSEEIGGFYPISHSIGLIPSFPRELAVNGNCEKV